MREKMYTADSKETCMEIGKIHVCVKIVVQIEKKNIMQDKLDCVFGRGRNSIQLYRHNLKKGKYRCLGFNH